MIITIVNYGMGNLGSIVNMLKKVGVQSTIASTEDEIARAERIILPGVGHFDKAIEQIRLLGLLNVLNKKAMGERVPILGICLGMQLLTRGSEEGKLPGLGWVPATTRQFKFDRDKGLKVPHMGWNTVFNVNGTPLTRGFDGEFRFYFVHSYYVRVDNEEDSMLKSFYGLEFDSGVHKDNIYGVQFHPEKSHKFGMKLLQNFVEM